MTFTKNKLSKYKHIFTIRPRQILFSEFMSIHFKLQTYNSKDFHTIIFTSWLELYIHYIIKYLSKFDIMTICDFYILRFHLRLIYLQNTLIYALSLKMFFFILCIHFPGFQDSATFIVIFGERIWY